MRRELRKHYVRSKKEVISYCRGISINHAGQVRVRL